MVNKSMMHTRASGCYKRRSLPAHSLAAAGLSLLLAFSCPLTVRADANLSTAEAIGSFYEIDVPNNIGNLTKFENYSWINNVTSNRINESAHGLQVFSSVSYITETGDDDPPQQEFEFKKITVESNYTETLNTGTKDGYIVKILEGGTLKVTSGNVNIVNVTGVGNLLIDIEDNRNDIYIESLYLKEDPFKGNIILKNGHFITSYKFN